MHADAVVRCNTVDPELEQRLTSVDKPLLNHSNDELADNYLNFYNSLLSGNV
jgi:hypothetical protein